MKRRTENANKILFTLLAIICIAIFCFAITPKTLQNDTYYTVTIGKYIYENGISNLTEDYYSWHDLPYTYPHWLYDLGMYIVYNMFSWEGIYAFTVILCIMLGISIFYISSKLSKNEVISFLVTLGSMYILKSFIAARAQLVTFILFAWTIYFIEKFLETHKKRYMVMLILIPLLISNVHCAVFPFYFVLFLPYIGEYFIAVLADLDLDKRLEILICKILKLISKKITIKKEFVDKEDNIKLEIEERKRKRKSLREKPYKILVTKNHWVIALILIMIIAFFTGVINPTGLGAYTYTYKIMQGNTTYSINEHLPLTLFENKEFAVAICIFLVVLIFTDTKIKLSDLFMLCGITFLAFKMRRQVSMFAIFCAFILAKMIANFLNKYDKNFLKKTLRISTSAIGAILIILIVGTMSYDLYKPIRKNNFVDSSLYPVAAAEWIKNNLDLENLKLYNEYNYGSYLLYEGIPVFIDSRCDLYTPEFNANKEENIEGKDIFLDAINIASISVDYEKKFTEYGVTHVICYHNSKLAMLLADDSNYEEIYNDDSFKIFERKSANQEYTVEMEMN